LLPPAEGDAEPLIHKLLESFIEIFNELNGAQAYAALLDRSDLVDALTKFRALLWDLNTLLIKQRSKLNTKAANALVSEINEQALLIESLFPKAYREA
jgi:hypothetical protein